MLRVRYKLWTKRCPNSNYHSKYIKLYTDNSKQQIRRSYSHRIKFLIKNYSEKTTLLLGQGLKTEGPKNYNY